MSTHQLDHAEHSTVMAALRFYQHHGMGEPFNRPDWLHDLASDGGAVDASLNADAIDELCERLNLESKSAARGAPVTVDAGAHEEGAA